jgi:hypothetical protein
MAKVRDNLITEGLSGKLGKRLVFRKSRGGGTILAVSPVYSTTREYSETELEHQEAFRKAIQYAKVAKDQPLYVQRARGTEATAYNLAVADWFGRPEILMVDTTEWDGQIGQIIRIKAQDDTQVKSVYVSIEGADDTVFEQGQAVLSGTDSLWWVYTATSLLPAQSNPRIVVTARDLPGNSHDMVWSNN